MRRHVASGGLTILDLLLPASFRPNRSLPLRPYHHVSTQRVVDGYRQVPVFAAQSRRPPWSIATSRGGELSKSRTAPLNLSCQTFSTSFTRRATHAIFNPQVDDEGNEMMLEITPRAAKRLSEIMAKDSNPNLALRIQVESGGCHGFQYLMKLVTLPPSLPSKESLPPAAEEDASAAIREDDTIFTYVPDDNSSPGDLAAPKIILDFPSLELLKGSKVDFTMELIGSQFKIVDNPLATSSCGCGTSFDIKI